MSFSRHAAPTTLSHIRCMPHFLFLPPICSLFGAGRGTGEGWGAFDEKLRVCPMQEVAPMCANSGTINTFVVTAWVTRGISICSANFDLPWGHFYGTSRGKREETGGLCFYLRDCNNNHTSATGLVASIILSTVEQKCMGVKNILVWMCVDARVCLSPCVYFREMEGWV